MADRSAHRHNELARLYNADSRYGCVSVDVADRYRNARTESHRFGHRFVQLSRFRAQSCDAAAKLRFGQLLEPWVQRREKLVRRITLLLMPYRLVAGGAAVFDQIARHLHDDPIR